MTIFLYYINYKENSENVLYYVGFKIVWSRNTGKYVPSSRYVPSNVLRASSGLVPRLVASTKAVPPYQSAYSSGG